MRFACQSTLIDASADRDIVRHLKVIILNLLVVVVLVILRFRSALLQQIRMVLSDDEWGSPLWLLTFMRKVTFLLNCLLHAVCFENAFLTVVLRLEVISIVWNLVQLDVVVRCFLSWRFVGLGESQVLPGHLLLG